MTEISSERGVPVFGDANAVWLSNADIELIASTSYGPRTLAYQHRGRANAFGVLSPSE